MLQAALETTGHVSFHALSVLPSVLSSSSDTALPGLVYPETTAVTD